MYGIANQGVKDLVVTKHGPAAWAQICQEIGHTPDDFVLMENYPDKLTYDLVGAASRVLGASATQILADFGRHWILFTSREGYGPMMDLFGTDLSTCLMNLNNLHARMGMTMPHLQPPRFGYSRTVDGIHIVEYHSKRPGLHPILLGMFDGLAEKFGIRVEVQMEEPAPEALSRVFRIREVG